MSSTTHRFGGDWTEDKLARLGAYLHAYMKIFTKGKYASRYETIYVDAFAGTGSRDAGERGPLFDAVPELAEADAQRFLKGSARIALEIEHPFDRYVFVEQTSTYHEELSRIGEDYPHLRHRIDVRRGEANAFLTSWCGSVNWSESRAVVFLDPYGMQVNWATIECLARTHAIDMWFLFPLGSGVNRLLTTKGPPPDLWANALTRALGTEAWRTEFYARTAQHNLFGEVVESEQKSANWDGISAFVIKRLSEVFEGVAENPLFLYNSQRTPLYMLCFASGARGTGSQIAVRIAEHLLKPTNRK